MDHSFAHDGSAVNPVNSLYSTGVSATADGAAAISDPLYAFAQHGRALGQAGWPVLPVITPGAEQGAGKRPGWRQSDGSVYGLYRWQSLYPDLTSPTAFADLSSEASIGVICGGPHGIVGVDIDSDEHADALEAMAVQHLGPTDFIRSRANSGRKLLVYRCAEPLDKKAEVAGLLGTMGTGSQFVAIGVHTSGVTYDWPRRSLIGAKLADLPTITRAQRDALLAAVKAFAEAHGLVKAKPARNRAAAAAARTSKSAPLPGASAVPTAPLSGKRGYLPLAYFDKALDRACAAISDPSDGRKRRMFAESASMGRLVAGNAIHDAGTVLRDAAVRAVRRLLAAAMTHSGGANAIDRRQIERDVRRGWQFGIAEPRPVLGRAGSGASPASTAPAWTDRFGRTHTGVWPTGRVLPETTLTHAELSARTKAGIVEFFALDDEMHRRRLDPITTADRVAATHHAEYRIAALRQLSREQTGAGKTRGYIEAIKDVLDGPSATDRQDILCVHSGERGDEVAADMAAAGVPHRVVRGREASCTNPDLKDEVALSDKLGIGSFTLCMECPFFKDKTCEYWKQSRHSARGEVQIVQRYHLVTGRIPQNDEVSAPIRTITIDESVLDNFIATTHALLADLPARIKLPALIGEPGDEHRASFQHRVERETVQAFLDKITTALKAGLALISIPTLDPGTSADIPVPSAAVADVLRLIAYHRGSLILEAVPMIERARDWLILESRRVTNDAIKKTGKRRPVKSDAGKARWNLEHILNIVRVLDLAADNPLPLIEGLMIRASAPKKKGGAQKVTLHANFLQRIPGKFLDKSLLFLDSFGDRAVIEALTREHLPDPPSPLPPSAPLLPDAARWRTIYRELHGDAAMPFCRRRRIWGAPVKAGQLHSALRPPRPAGARRGTVTADGKSYDRGAVVEAKGPKRTFNLTKQSKRVDAAARQVLWRVEIEAEAAWNEFGRDALVCIIAPLPTANAYRRYFETVWHDRKHIVMHFGAMQGSNAAREAVKVIQIGQFRPPQSVVMDKAAALAAAHWSRPQVTGCRWDRPQRTFTVAGREFAALAWRPLEPLAALVADSAELGQAGQGHGRSRGASRTAETPCEHVTIDEAPVGAWDELEAWRKLDQLDVFAARWGGRLPLDAAEAVRLAPDLFPTRWVYQRSLAGHKGVRDAGAQSLWQPPLCLPLEPRLGLSLSSIGTTHQNRALARHQHAVRIRDMLAARRAGFGKSPLAGIGIGRLMAVARDHNGSPTAMARALSAETGRKISRDAIDRLKRTEPQLFPGWTPEPELLAEVDAEIAAMAPPPTTPTATNAAAAAPPAAAPHHVRPGAHRPGRRRDDRGGPMGSCGRRA